MSDIIIAFDILKNILLSTQNRFDITGMFSPKLATVYTIVGRGGGNCLNFMHLIRATYISCTLNRAIHKK